MCLQIIRCSACFHDKIYFCLSATKEYIFRFSNVLVFITFFFMIAVYIERTMVYIVDEPVYIKKYKPMMRWCKCLVVYID